MKECIQCGIVHMFGEVCNCGGALIPALSDEAAGEQYLNRLRHFGIDMSKEEIKSIQSQLRIKDLTAF